MTNFIDGIMAGMLGTIIFLVRTRDQVVVIGDGQVIFGNIVMKGTARKVRRLHQDTVITGFAGSTADAFTLFERFEGKLKEYGGNLRRAAVELAKDWRTDRALRRLEALLICANTTETLIISGSGDVIEFDHGVAAIGSGGKFAESAALALIRHSDLDARTIAVEAMKVAAEICIYTNDHFTVEALDAEETSK